MRSWADKTRIPKSLYTAHPKGIRPVLATLSTEYVEAAYLASEVKRFVFCFLFVSTSHCARLVAHTGGMLKWGDFAILCKVSLWIRPIFWYTVRFNALSRAIESALQKEGIPNRILNGHKFFERMEVSGLYLLFNDWDFLFVDQGFIGIPPDSR